MERMARRAVFLDRDGTLNIDPGYLRSPDQMALIPNVGRALAVLQQAGFLIVVVSNQSGVGRGLIRAEVMPLIHQKMEELLALEGGKIDHYSLCFHKPEDGCLCRKPRPDLILSAAQHLQVDPRSSYMIGDKSSDIEAGNAAGCKGSILVRTGYGKEVEALWGAQWKDHADFIGDSLWEAAQWILVQENVSP